MKTQEKILSLIIKGRGCTHEGFLAVETGLKLATVKRHVRALVKLGRVERGWDNKSLGVTDEEILRKLEDERVKSHR